MDTAYKVYANILNKKLKKEINKKLEERQFGFRTGRRMIDAIYIMNYVVNQKNKEKKE